MSQSGIYRAPQGGPWQPEQYDLQAYWQQLSYPQLLSPGRPKPARRPHATRNLVAGLGAAVAAGAAAAGRTWHRLLLLSGTAPGICAMTPGALASGHCVCGRGAGPRAARPPGLAPVSPQPARANKQNLRSARNAPFRRNNPFGDSVSAPMVPSPHIPMQVQKRQATLSDAIARSWTPGDVSPRAPPRSPFCANFSAPDLPHLATRCQVQGCGSGWHCVLVRIRVIGQKRCRLDLMSGSPPFFRSQPAPRHCGRK